MKRRNFLKTAGVATAAAATATTTTLQASEKDVFNWKMVTTWPKNFPGVGTAAQFLADKIEQMTNGQVKVTVYGAGELVPPFEVFDAVSNGTAQLGHGASYYWQGKVPSAQFFSTIPFGMTTDEVNSWLYMGGGLELWQEAYAGLNVIPFPAGNSGVQMGGWFNKEINSVDDFKGLKMRIGGLGGKIISSVGGTPVIIPGGEIFTSLQSGVIDAVEFVGPYNDLAFGLHKAAKYYYYPGWQEPTGVIELTINKEAFEQLPEHLRGLVKDAAKIANQEMLADYNARSSDALSTLVNDHGVELKRFPDSVLKELKTISQRIIAEEAKKDEMSQKVYDSYMAFLKKVEGYTDITSRAYLNSRAL